MIDIFIKKLFYNQIKRFSPHKGFFSNISTEFNRYLSDSAARKNIKLKENKNEKREYDEFSSEIMKNVDNFRQNVRECLKVIDKNYDKKGDKKK